MAEADPQVGSDHTAMVAALASSARAAQRKLATMTSQDKAAALHAAAGELRARSRAILDANATPGADTIGFDIPGAGPHAMCRALVWAGGCPTLVHRPAAEGRWTDKGGEPWLHPFR